MTTKKRPQIALRPFALFSWRRAIRLPHPGDANVGTLVQDFFFVIQRNGRPTGDGERCLRIEVILGQSHVVQVQHRVATTQSQPRREAE